MVLGFGDKVRKGIVASVLLPFGLLLLGEANAIVMRVLNPMEMPTGQGSGLPANSHGSEPS